ADLPLPGRPRAGALRERAGDPRLPRIGRPARSGRAGGDAAPAGAAALGGDPGAHRLGSRPRGAGAEAEGARARGAGDLGAAEARGAGAGRSGGAAVIELLPVLAALGLYALSHDRWLLAAPVAAGLVFAVLRPLVLKRS